MTIELDGRTLALEAIEMVATGGATVAVTPQARERVAAARACVERQFRSGAIIYGVT
ncbi:MAG: aromatic amino acid lyase, partial [Candidatus Eremiobacteraeota bacterium]|nr:aromatic amino acid lyase [Candidatus Eremiobacteraeota bacterium]